MPRLQFGWVLGFAFALASAAQAAPITWVFTASVFFVGPAPPSGVASGQVATATITFDGATADDDPDPTTGMYVGAVVSFTLDVPEASFSESLPPFVPGANYVRVDTLLNRLQIHVAGSATINVLIDATSPFTSDALPSTPPPFALVSSNQLFRQQIGDEDNYFAAAFSSIEAVPEPGPALLAWAGIGVVAVRRCRARRS